MSSAGRSLWVPSSFAPQLTAGEVHLWRFPLETSSHDFTTLKSLLSADELQRADRLLDPRKAQDFIVCRARLRQILASYLAADPSQIEFCYGLHGKPALHAPAATNHAFNLTHSGEWALLAVAHGMKVGVDLEKIDPCLEYESLAARFFTFEENTALTAAPEGRRRRTFYRLWTEKEARLKGEGGGFSIADGAAQAGWTTRPFWLGRGYVGSVACDVEIQSFRKFCYWSCMKQLVKMPAE